MAANKPAVYNNYVNGCKTLLGKSDLKLDPNYFNINMYSTEYTRSYTWPIREQAVIHSVPHTNVPMIQPDREKEAPNPFMAKVRANGCWSRLEEILEELCRSGLDGQDVKLVQKALHHRRLDAAIECAARYLKERRNTLLKKRGKDAAANKRAHLFQLCSEFAETVNELKKL